MLEKSNLDMSRPNLFYAAGVGLAVCLSLVVSNIPKAAVSLYLTVPNRQLVSLSLFGAAAVLAALTLQRYMSRLKFPWKVPQSQVSTAYLLFLASVLAAIALSH